ncbi:DNA/RNA-binding protein alba-like protein [Phlyctochytrium arcticum]|nr:DNA/RNA-binding protein alba-like protein [Phlyctochytrium arcticum]
MEGYRRKTVGNDTEELLQDNELRIKTSTKIRSYVTQALGFLNDEKFAAVVISGRGKQVNKAVTVAEIVKRKADRQIRQETSIASVTATDIWDPVDLTLDRLEVIRHVPCVIITLSVSSS